MQNSDSPLTKSISSCFLMVWGIVSAGPPQNDRCDLDGNESLTFTVSSPVSSSSTT